MVVLALAVAGFAAAVLTASDGSSDVTLSGREPVGGAGDGGGTGSDDIVLEYIPGRGVEAFQQAEVGLRLAPGWALRDFTLNEVAIPDDELDVTAEIDRYVFRPGDGKTVTALEPQTNCASAVVFQQGVDQSRQRTERWCFEVL